MNFIHASDIHLGYKQYDLKERFRDFGNSFMEIINDAVSSKVEFVLISGDLFYNRNINAPTFTQAHHVLSMLKEANIPCIAIEGNHDRAFLKDGMSWLETLEWQGLLKLIKPGQEHLMENYIDINGVRIFGMPYQGSMTSSIIPAMAEEIRAINLQSPTEYTILMMHLGIEDFMKANVIGEVAYEDLVPLKGVVDYLALGHYHNTYEVDGWIYNPGSPDTCSISEVSESKGYYHVTDRKPVLKQVNSRKFIMVDVSVNSHTDTESLMKEIDARLSMIRAPEKEPVVYVTLRGTLNFSRSYLDIDRIKESVRSKINTIYTDVKLYLLNDEFCIDRLESENFDRTSIEREVFKKIVSADSMLSSDPEALAAMLCDLKDLAAEGADNITLDSVLRKIFDDIKSNKKADRPEVTRIMEKIEKIPVKEAPVSRASSLADMIEGEVWDWRNK